MKWLRIMTSSTIHLFIVLVFILSRIEFVKAQSLPSADCESIISTSGYEDCINVLFNFNISGLVTLENGCRLYYHSVKCIEDKLNNNACTAENIHKVLPKILVNYGILLNGFDACEVNITVNGYCNDSVALLTKGISLCGANVERSCAYFEDYLTQCYLSAEQAEYFQCSDEQIRNQLIEQVDWYLSNWRLNISECSAGETTKIDICRNSAVLTEVHSHNCFELVNNYNSITKMTNEDKCRLYFHLIRCLQTEALEVNSNFSCPLLSLHSWFPGYLNVNSYYRVTRNFDAYMCNVSETLSMEEFCNDSRAVFLSSVNRCPSVQSHEIFSCGHVKYLMDCTNYFRYTTYLNCNDKQKEKALVSEGNWFNNTLNIDVKDCFNNGINVGNNICNSSFNDRVLIYGAFHSCFEHIRLLGHYNRSKMLQLDGACLVYLYAMDCVKDELLSKTTTCKFSSLHEWLSDEIYPKSVILDFSIKCNVTEETNETAVPFCDNSLAVYNYAIGFCYYSSNLNSGLDSQSSVCQRVNYVLQYCYKRIYLYRNRCSYANVISAFINQTDLAKKTMRYDISGCFNGCAKTSVCCSSYSYYHRDSCYSSVNSTTRCSCDYRCHMYDSCCPDVSQTCICNGNITQYTERSGCLSLISKFNNSGLLTYEDGCRQYIHVLQCIEKGSGCSKDFIRNFTDNYIKTRYNIDFSFSSQCNGSTIVDFCNDNRGIFLALSDHRLTDNIFNCGPYYQLYNSYDYLNYWYNSAYMKCKHKRAAALIEQLELKYETLNLQSCYVNSNNEVNICNGVYVRLGDIYLIFPFCFNDIQTWFNGTGMIDSKTGCRYYHHLLQCVRRSLWYYRYNGSYHYENLKCNLSSIHSWFKGVAFKESAIYNLVQTCKEMDDTSKNYCDDDVAKYVGLFGVSEYASSELISAMKNSRSVCQKLDDIVLKYINTSRGSYFTCKYSNMLSALEYNHQLLQKHIGVKVSECINVTEASTSIPGPSFTPGSIYSYGYDLGDISMKGDEVVSPKIPIPIGFPTTNRFFDFLQIGSNGLISFTVARNFNPPEPIPFNQLGGIDFIAPFWTDMDSRYDRSNIYYHAYDRNDLLFDRERTNHILTKATDDVIHFYNISDFFAEWVFIVTWDNVWISGNLEPSKGLSFQCVLVTDGSDSFVIFNYLYMGRKIRQGTKAAIGYRLSNSKQNELSFQDDAFKISNLNGNVGINGFYIYKLSDDRYKNVNYRQLCYRWYSKYNTQRSYVYHLYSARYNCPCSLRSIRFDWRWMKIQSNQNGVTCFVLFASRLLPATRTCCYNEFYGNYIRIEPAAGTFHLHHPIFSPRTFRTEESLPKEYCCYRSNLCHLFLNLRPIGWCYGRTPFTFRWFWGDPHIETLDGLQYTFNGLGEYQLFGFKDENVTFGLQARTDLIVSENGTYSNATIFSAFAAKENNATLQVELTKDRKHIAVFANDQEYTSRFRDEDNFTIYQKDISMSRQNSTLVVMFGTTGLQLNVTLGIRMLTFSLTVPNEFKNSTYGLVGNFDGNKDNDFVLPNGTILHANNTNTEKKIFYNFGVHWAINDSTSLFNYSNGKSSTDYSHPEFIPLFIDEFPEEDVKKSREICGGTQASSACIYDYLLTKDKSVGLSSGQVDQTAKITVKDAENQIPEITGTESVHAVIGQTVSIYVNGSDDGNVTYRVIQGPNDTSLLFVSDKNEYQWTPQDMSPVQISITAVDDYDVAAPPLDVIIVACNNCSGHGDCLFNETRETNTPNFKYAVCNCDVGWTGDFCNDEVNGCSGFPCSNNRTCSDLSPDEELALGRGYNCSSCEKGYVENGQKCDDIDECTESNHGCSQNCTNTVGSYFCECMSGYKLVNGTSCVDINECEMKIDGCEQICTNHDGTYVCSCWDGFKPKTDGHSCDKVKDLCSGQDLNCTYACINETRTGTYKCACPAGQTVASDGFSCEDEDECKFNVCEQNCNNTDGSFICSCNDGYYLDADKLHCSRCDVGFWGPNCANQCGCGEGAEKCNAAYGCVCEQGYTGQQCNHDTDECTNDTQICSKNETCQNTIGSYMCICNDGFSRNGNVCERTQSIQIETTSSSVTKQDDTTLKSSVRSTSEANTDATTTAAADYTFAAVVIGTSTALSIILLLVILLLVLLYLRHKNQNRKNDSAQKYDGKRGYRSKLEEERTTTSRDTTWQDICSSEKFNRIDIPRATAKHRQDN